MVRSLPPQAYPPSEKNNKELKEREQAQQQEMQKIEKYKNRLTVAWILVTVLNILISLGVALLS